MKRIITALFLTLAVSFMAHAQGIRFAGGLSWQQIKAKAKAENKYIFVDGYATWCIPCKRMDSEVYPNDSLGVFMNARFISVKVQMDSTKNDADFVKQWRADANEMMREHRVTAFPTYLFLDAEGYLLHKGVGFKTAGDFMVLARIPADPASQYHALLGRYRAGTLPCAAKNYLARTAKQFRENELADSIAADYIADCFAQLPDAQRWTKENIQFMISFTKASSDKSFQLIYQNREKINQIMGNDTFAQMTIENIIMKEQVYPVLKMAQNENLKEIDWEKLIWTITSKYDTYTANSAITFGKMNWYGRIKNYGLYCKYLIEKVENYSGVDVKKNTFYINNSAWKVFQYSQDKDQLYKALFWIEGVVNMEPEDAASLDTYANLLYKLGERQKAITVQQKAVQYARRDQLIELNSTLKKMQTGEPTWSKIQD